MKKFTIQVFAMDLQEIASVTLNLYKFYDMPSLILTVIGSATDYDLNYSDIEQSFDDALQYGQAELYFGDVYKVTFSFCE